MAGDGGTAVPILVERSRRANDAVAAAITVVTTSMWFLYALVVFVALWMRFSPALHLDTGPSYPVMLYWVNLFQALMLPILAVGQSVLNRANERRQQHEAEVVDRLDHLTRRILALEEAHASAHLTRQKHQEAVLEHLEGITQRLTASSSGPPAN